MSEVLHTRALTLRLGGRTVLDRVTAACRPGRVTALLGPNGAGKSSLLACLAGLRTADAGAAMLGDRAILEIERRDRARRIGFLPQASDVHWNVDVQSLVALGRLPHRGRWGETAADRAAVAQAMAATEVAHLAARGVEQLSGGERGRVLIARVLAGEPDWLLADEPLASLDPAHQLDVLDLLRAAASRGAGVIVVLHDLHLAHRVADDAVLLSEGRVVASGAAEAVLTPALLGETYGVAVETGTTASGRRYILPVARA
ncbi:MULTISPECIES: ABC transporter ATP-binding protein [Sphingomonas]|uniref:ABC transporter ATP-binding protein n=1 Tax=Sphingomonas TaxID=13687 RepID=UPI000829B52E|nr:ABC transporter ATP-binding protein [Sphingomonas sp. CCH10-B3]